MYNFFNPFLGHILILWLHTYSTLLALLCGVSSSYQCSPSPKDQAPVPLSIFRSNSKFDENSERSIFKYIRSITMIFCTRHDSDTDVTCAKYRCDRPRIFYTRVFWIFIELVGRAPVMWNFHCFHIVSRKNFWAKSRMTDQMKCSDAHVTFGLSVAMNPYPFQPQ